MADEREQHRDDARQPIAPTRASLLERVRDAENIPAWREFCDVYKPLILGRVRNARIPEPQAEEVVQEIFIGLSRGLPGFIYNPAECRFRTWLYRIVQNQIANYFRRATRRGRLQEVALDEGLAEEVPDLTAAAPDRSWEEEWEKNIVQAALARVRKRANLRYMQLFLYSEYQGHSVAETARDLEATPGEVSVARSRIKKMLREEGERIRRAEALRDQGRS